MATTKSEQYWNNRSRFYPHQVKVTHMSDQDIDPGRFSRMTSANFLRVPFDGVAHWGFETAAGLSFFKRVVGL